jgi:hypothetical protein
MAKMKKAPNYSENETKMPPPTDAERKKYGMAPAPKNPPYPPPKKMAKGGVTRADGCAMKGKTKGRMI